MKNIFKLCLFLTIVSLLSACQTDKENTDAFGVFEATEITVSSENNGKLLVFNIEEGRTYEKDEIVGYIDSSQLCLQMQQLDASIKAALARQPDMPSQIQVLQDKLVTLEKEKNRVTNLVEANAASTKDLDDILAEINITKSQITATKSTLSIQSQAILEEVEAMRIQKMQLANQVKKCQIKTPINGTVIKKYINESELAFQGKPLFKVADLTNMFIEVYVTEDMLSSIKLGQKATIHIDAANGAKKNFEGKIAWISPKAEFTPKMIQTKNERVNLVYAVKVTFKNDGSAKIGMPGDVTFN
ncbi:MAG: efflux RND transporter periplasmic adaptor subunit [Bacteroidales bacterium]|nr:efflux RND transporter periplasmic adaptor subunit [Bacteroidales bacterium]